MLFIGARLFHLLVVDILVRSLLEHYFESLQELFLALLLLDQE